MTTSPDPTLLDRLQASASDVGWAAARVRQHQHVELEGEWSAHRHVFHLIATERENYQPRLRRLLDEDAPVLEVWDSVAHMAAEYDPDDDIDVLAAGFVRERERTCEMFRALTPEQWARRGTWPDGTVIDVAWLASKALWHALDHGAFLVALHTELEPLHTPA